MRPSLLTAPARRDALLAGLAALAGVAVSLLALQAGRDNAVMLVLPLAVTAIIAAAVVLLFACAGSPPAICAFLIVLVFVNDALFRVRQPGDLGADWQTALKLALWAGAAAIGAGQIGRSWRLYLQTPVMVALIYVGIGMVSAIYSEAPIYSFGTAFGMFAMLLFAGGMAVTLSERQLLLCFAISLWIFVLIGWVVYFAVPSLGRSLFITADGSIVERICGLAGQANALGCTLAVLLGLVFLLWYRGHCRLLTVLPMGATGFFTLLIADSRTALLGFLIGTVAVVVRRSLWVWGSSLLAGSLGIILLAAVPLRNLLGLTSGFSRSGDPGEMFTLTGRTEIWAFVWDRIVVQPWFGYGYNSSKFILPLFLGLPGLTVDEAHNTWLQNLLGTGIVGTAPLVLLMVIQLVEYVRSPAPFRDLFLFIVLVWGVTVAGAYGSTPTVMTLAVFASLLCRARELASASPRVARPAFPPTGYLSASRPR